MEVFTKQVLIMIFSILVGTFLVLYGITEKIHSYSSEILRSLIDNDNPEKTEKLTEALGYFVEIVLASLILMTPFCGVSGIWYLKIAFELIIGKNANMNVFLVNTFLNKTMAFFCFLLFFYSLYSQYQWTIRLTQPRKDIKKDRDLTRLI